MYVVFYKYTNRIDGHYREFGIKEMNLDEIDNQDLGFFISSIFEDHIEAISYKTEMERKEIEDREAIQKCFKKD